MPLLITRETDYALRILRALGDGEKHTVKALCETEDVPQQFAYKIIRKLAQAKLVQSTRGVDGGCQLTADLRQVSLLDLLDVMEEERQVSACLRPGYACQWEEKHAQCCMVHRRLAGIQQALDQELRSHTLYDLFYGEK